MSSYVLAITSDAAGNPYTGPGRIGHVVWVVPAAVEAAFGIPVVNEFTSGGPLAHVACAPSVIRARLLQGGRDVPISEIEAVAGTSLPNGTLVPGIERALRAFGVAESFSPSNPLPGWMMNPAGGRLVSPAAFPQYLAASQGGCIVMADPVTPPPPPIEEPEMQTFVIEPGSEPTLIPGLAGTSTLNLVADVSVSVELFIWEPDGTPVATKVVALLGNGAVAGKGPAQVSGYLRDVLDVATFMGPCTLYLAAAAVPYSVSVY